MRLRALRGIFILAVLGWAVHPCFAGRVTVKPGDNGALLANPGMGWQTFHHTAAGDVNLQGLPSAVAYYRFYWKELEPEEGKIDVAKLDALLAKCRESGQRLAFRVMCVGTNEDAVHVPSWLREQGCRGFAFTYGDDGIERWAPDYEDPRFLEAHVRMIRALGKRYDGHPDVDHLDIGTVGLWAEWHMSGTGVDMPGERTQREIVDAWREAFPKTPKVVLIGSDVGMSLATKWHLGWRADCLGDMGGFSKTWNHMDHMYRQQVEKTGAGEAWKAAPVAFETCWDMRKWVKEGWDVRAIFDYALSLHASYVNNKSAPVPAGSRGEVERLLKKLGYRFVLNRLSHEAAVEPGSTMKVSTDWENAGVAPPYEDRFIALRLENGDGALTRVTGLSVRGWLPGPRRIDLALEVPADLAEGTYDLAIGIVDPRAGEPAVNLPLDGRTPDGWYPVSAIRVGR